MRYEAIVIGVSAGGIEALKVVLSALPAGFAPAVAIVQHRDPRSDGFLADYLGRHCALAVREAEDKEPLRGGQVYLAPAGYHLLVEPDRSFSLSVDARVNFCCPSIDVLFESAAEAFGRSLVGIVLTGANGDGANGLRAMKRRGGLAIVENPASARVPAMPLAALKATPVDHLLHLGQIAPLLAGLGRKDATDAAAS